MNFTIINALPIHIKSIRNLAYEIWNEHYPAIIGQKQVDYMLNSMYSEASLKEQLKHIQFYLIQENEKPIGFISAEVKELDQGFIPKCYVLKDYRGTGAAQLLMQKAFDYLKSKGCNTVRLQVNRQNVMAINFYFKIGFKIEKSADFPIGKGFEMNDFIMIKNL